MVRVLEDKTKSLLSPTSRAAIRIQSEAVIFDFDFTLADSSQGIVECVGYALRELGFPIPSAERVVDTIGLSLAATFSRLTGQDGSDMATDFVRYFHQHADQVMDSHTVVYGCATTAGITSQCQYPSWSRIDQAELSHQKYSAKERPRQIV